MSLPPFQASYDSDEADAISAHNGNGSEGRWLCDCGREFLTEHAFKVHRGRMHPNTPKTPKTPRTPRTPRSVTSANELEVVARAIFREGLTDEWREQLGRVLGVPEWLR